MSGPHIDAANAPAKADHRHQDARTGVITNLAGAVEVQRQFDESVECFGFCSVFIVFSVRVTTILLAKRFLTPSEAPGGQCKNDRAKRAGNWYDLQGVVADMIGEDGLQEGVDYKVFAVPASGIWGYAIPPACCHAFFRGESFRGLVHRFWWETLGLDQENEEN